MEQKQQVSLRRDLSFSPTDTHTACATVCTTLYHFLLRLSVFSLLEEMYSRYDTSIRVLSISRREFVVPEQNQPTFCYYYYC